jgi:hypothetical protein
MRHVPNYNQPKTEATPISRLTFLSDLRRVCLSANSSSNEFISRKSFGFGCEITPAGLPVEKIHIQFQAGNPSAPVVTTKNLNHSPHRYPNGSLCMWYPKDPPHLRWQWRDGAETLIALICAHLIKESWWNQTGEWVGLEAPHSPLSEGSVISEEGIGVVK